MGTKLIARNRKAKFEYFILEKFEAGIVLRGSEIKSVRAGHISINEAYVMIENMQAYLVDSHISLYEQAARSSHEPKRRRTLLLHKREIKELWNAVRQKGVTIVPICVYFKDGLAKIEVAIAKGKRIYDKRQAIAARDLERERQSALKQE